MKRGVNKDGLAGIPRNWVLRALSLCYLEPTNATISCVVPKGVGRDTSGFTGKLNKE